MWKMLEQVPRSRLGKLVQVVFPQIDLVDHFNLFDHFDHFDHGHHSLKAGSHQHILSLCDTYSLVDNEYFFDR